MPLLRRTEIGSGNHNWLGSSHGFNNAPTGTLDVEAFTEATHYPDGYIPSGTPVDASDLKALKPFVAPEDITVGEDNSVSPTVANLGFLLDNVEVVDGEAAPVAVLRHGSIVVENVPGDFTAPAAAVGFIFE